MCVTAVRPAAQHAQALMRQGKSKRAAIDHAVQRFGVTHGAIIREIRSWHEFQLPAEREFVCPNGHTASEATALMKPWCGCGHQYREVSVPSDDLDYFGRLRFGLV